MKIVNVYVIMNRKTGRYDEGCRPGGRVSCTAEFRDDAMQYDDDELAEEFPNGVPSDLEAIKICSFERKER